jgi:hypothetical protein
MCDSFRAGAVDTCLHQPFWPHYVFDHLMSLTTFHRSIAAVLSVFVLTGQMFASMPGSCGCSNPMAEGQPSCCSTADTGRLPSSPDDGCCSDDKCGLERTECCCGCTDSQGEEQPAPAQDNRVLHKSSVADMSLRIELEVTPPNASPATPVSARGHRTASAQILFCVWQT